MLQPLRGMFFICVIFVIAQGFLNEAGRLKPSLRNNSNKFLQVIICLAPFRPSAPRIVCGSLETIQAREVLLRTTSPVVAKYPAKRPSQSTMLSSKIRPTCTATKLRTNATLATIWFHSQTNFIALLTKETYW